MLKSIIVPAAIAWLVGAGFAPRAFAIDPGSAACKREMQGAHKKMQESLALIDSVKDAPAPAKCPAFSAAGALADEIRESAARCEEPRLRTSAVRDADDVIEAIDKAYEKWCPPKAGMVRVKMTMVERLTPDKLPKPLQAVHRCIGEGATMYSFNERFELGRLIVLGCPGNPNPTPEQTKARNATAAMLSQEQAQAYLTRDRDGDDPRRLSFPILTEDGAEGATDMLVANRISIAGKLDLIQSYWETGKAGVCRVHALWRVTDGKAKLVLWQEAADCSKGAKTEFKTVLDRR